jgi:MoaA/NifB/PqqE/SkfB family radical SAM enzyme
MNRAPADFVGQDGILRAGCQPALAGQLHQPESGLPTRRRLTTCPILALDLSGHLVMPGLINAHDHLAFNLFPLLGHGPYPNAGEWARDIYHPGRSPIREHLRVPTPVRLWWGALKNLLSGVTTVCHHNPYEREVFGADFPVRVVRRFAWAHSLEFEPELAARFRKAPPSYPFLVHCAEGIDAAARREVQALDALGALDERTAIIHGVGITGAGLALMRRRRASLVWCPTSNLAMLGRTVSRAVLRSGIPMALATDSALSAPVDLLDELAVARKYLAPARLLRNGDQHTGAHSASRRLSCPCRLDRGPFRSPNAGGGAARRSDRAGGGRRPHPPDLPGSGAPTSRPRAPPVPTAAHRKSPARAGGCRRPRAAPRRHAAPGPGPPARRQTDPPMKALLDRLPILVLEPHNRCNCRCVMCDIWKLTDAREIGAAELERHLADIQRLGVEWVVLTGGEPLMHSDLFRLSALLRGRGIRTTILSTGLLLERNAARIAEGVDEVIVSLDGPAKIHDEIRRVPGAFDLLAKGVRAVHRISPEFPISARCTVQASNAAHLRTTVQAARGMGFRSLSFLAADLSSSAFNRPLEWSAERQSNVAPELAALDGEMEALIASYPADGFILEAPEKLRRIVAHFRAHCGLEGHIAPRCSAPWVFAVLESNGDVRPCFFHAVIGNAAVTTLGAVLNGPQAIAFRESLRVADNPICQRCVCSLYVETSE